MSIEVCVVCFLNQAGFKGRTQILVNALIGNWLPVSGNPGGLNGSMQHHLI
jgi:hypothetical protein